MCYTTNMDVPFIKLQPTAPNIKLSIKKLYTTHHYYYSKDFLFKGEYHDCWELVYLQKGKVVIDTPEYSVTLSSGQAFLHTPNEKHAIRANNTTCSVFCYTFDCDSEYLFNIAHRPLAISRHLNDQLLFLLDEMRIASAGKNGILDSFSQKPFASSQMAKTLLEYILLLLIRANTTTTITTNPEQYKKTYSLYVQHIIDHLTAHLQSKVTLEEIAQHIGFSIPHICALFKNEVGVSIKAYHEQLRMEHAKHLLSTTNMSVQEISDYFNFDSVQHFSLRFKKNTGFTPSQFSSYIKSRNYYSP